MEQKLVNHEGKWIFIILISIYLFVTWLSQEFIYNEALFYKSYTGTMAHQTIEEVLGIQSQFWWMGYVFTPIILLLKFLFTSTCISIGVTLTNIEIKFKEIFKSAMIAEGVFIVAQISFILILYVNLNEMTLQNASGFFPLSALGFIGIENVNAQWAIYPLQTVNLFQVFYVLTIAWLLSRQDKYSFAESLNVVIPSYGLGLLLWVTLVAFLTLQLS